MVVLRYTLYGTEGSIGKICRWNSVQCLIHKKTRGACEGRLSGIMRPSKENMRHALQSRERQPNHEESVPCSRRERRRKGYDRRYRVHAARIQQGRLPYDPRTPHENTHIFVREDEFMAKSGDMIARTRFDGHGRARHRRPEGRTDTKKGHVPSDGNVPLFAFYVSSAYSACRLTLPAPLQSRAQPQSPFLLLPAY